jgi:EmrB/QacA subfamily drug resistance transporter
MKPRSPLYVTSLIAGAFFMENLDGTVIATALPQMAKSFHASAVSLNIGMTAYMLTLAVLIPISGWVTDRFGSRSVFATAVGIFTFASLLCAVSQNLTQFTLMRILQGMGGAMMVPVGRLVVLRSVPKSQLVTALAYLTFPALVGPVLGPPVGGLITTWFDWRWIFFINLPIGCAGIVLASLYFEDIRETERPPLDVFGFVLLGTGLAALMLGLASAGRHLLPAAVSWGCLAAGAILLPLYWAYARRVAHPIVRLDLMQRPTFRVAVIGGSLFRIGTGAIPFLLPLMLQVGFGLDALHSGLITFAAAAGAMFVKTLAPKILRRTGFRTLMVWNALLASVFLAVNGLYTAETPHWIMLALLFIGGCSRSVQFTCVNAIAYADLESREMSAATSFASVCQQLSLSLGVTLGALALEGTAAWHGRTQIEAGDFGPAFFAVAMISAASVLGFRQLSPDAGAEVSGRKRVVATPPSAEMTPRHG